MKKAYVSAGLTLLALLGVANAQTAAAPPMRSITQVAGDLYRFQNNAHFGMFMVTPQGIVVIDPINMDTANWLKGELASRFSGAKVVDVIYTHYHWDHASGAAAFPGAKIIARAETVKNLQPPAAADAKALENFRKQYADVLAPTETYDSPMKKFAVGGKTIELHHVPTRHANDLSYVYFPDDKVVFIVDVISLKRLPFRDMSDFEFADGKLTIEKALAFNAKTIVGGHGAMGTNQDVRDVQQYLNELRQGVQAGIDKGQSVEQIKSQLKLEKYASWESYDQFRTMNIDGMYALLTRK